MNTISIPMGVTSAQARAAMQQLLDAEVARLREAMSTAAHTLKEKMTMGAWRNLGEHIAALSTLHASLHRATDNAAAYRSATDATATLLDEAA